MSNIPNQYIAVSYRLYIDGDNGKEMVEEATAEQPFHFISGFGIALDAFEKQLINLKKDEDFAFSLEKEEAYGEYDLTHVVDLDREIFSINGHFDHEHIYVDAIIPLQNEDGNRFYGKVLEIGEEKVKVDLNHPLAGETLYFEGKVLENREATPEEIKGMIARMSGGCGCGCHDCDGDCGHEHDHGENCGCGHCH
ncbi:MAG: FKBP-type peptidyl-prolyl cis-trans isomerase [Prevotella sp.]|nr:FKBP-type peptidyl-prolyl cis-trans isomerase [Prevotella sp.]